VRIVLSGVRRLFLRNGPLNFPLKVADSVAEQRITNGLIATNARLLPRSTGLAAVAFCGSKWRGITSIFRSSLNRLGSSGESNCKSLSSPGNGIAQLRRTVGKSLEFQLTQAQANMLSEPDTRELPAKIVGYSSQHIRARLGLRSDRAPVYEYICRQRN